MEIVAGEAAEGVKECPEGADGADVGTAGRVAFGNGVVEFQKRGLAHDIEAHGHVVAVFGTLSREAGNADLSALHVELRHQLLDVLTEVVHALLATDLCEFEVGLCQLDAAFTAAPVENGKREGNAAVFLRLWMLIGPGHIVARLRETEFQIDVGTQAGIGLCHGQIAFRLSFAQFVISGVGAVLHGQFQRMAKRNFKEGDAVWQNKADGRVLWKTQEGTETLEAFFQTDFGIHDHGFLCEAANLKLNHLVLCDGANLVASLGHAIECVGAGKVASCGLHLAEGACQGEELAAGLCGNQFYGLGIVLLGIGIAQGFNAFVPLERVVAEEVLAVTH